MRFVYCARVLAVILAAMTLSTYDASPTAAQGATNFPNKPVTLIVPWTAGGNTDIYFRALGDAAAKELGQPVIVDNKTGGSGTLGPSTMALTAKPDGYTVAQVPISVFRLPHMQKVAFDPLRDFTYIIHISGYVLGMTTRADGPYKTWDDVVKKAKSDVPGKLTYATTGPATTPHIGTERVADIAGIKLTMVPFKGGAETNAAVLGGHVDLQVDSSVWQPLVDAGQLRLLMLWTEKRNKRWPNVPTLKELGFPFSYDSPFGVAGPKGMDPAIVEKLHQAFKKATQDPRVQEIMDRYDFVDRYMPPADYTKFVAEQVASERAALEKLGLLKKE
jgi:tripartite-type tricarboxylate transporter receptor subunit TctC